jgi:RimJ/RimL family protein N-acetyltransferase
MIEIVSPFPSIALPLAWNWLNEFPDRNRDDFGPQSSEEFVSEMEARERNEYTFGVLKEGELCGIVGYQPQSPYLGMLHGICFTRSAWGRQTTLTAVRMILGKIFEAGVEKVSASHFADNEKIGRFLRDLGAVHEGHLTRHTLRHGRPVDMCLVAIFKKDFLCHLPQ